MRFFVLLLICCICGDALPGKAAGFPRDLSGITVTGRATLAAPADFERFSAVLTQAPGGTHTLDPAAAAVVNALKSNGIADAASTDGAVESRGEARYITGTVIRPSDRSAAMLVRTMNEITERFPGVTATNFRATIGLNDCQVLERRMQIAAVQDAHDRAERLAKAANVQLGAPATITAGRLPGYAFPCTPSRMMEPIDDVAPDFNSDGNAGFGLFVNVTYKTK